jgi:hypothetical protein
MFPALPYESWSKSLLGLHLVSQMVGRVRLELHPAINHWWHATMYVSARGLTTGVMPIRGRSETLDIEIDLLSHEVVLRMSHGKTKKVDLSEKTVCDFYRDFTASLAELGIDVSIDVHPYKCRSKTPFPDDRDNGTYDRAAITTALQILGDVNTVFTEFRGRYVGKSSPVHLFWHSFDLAVTRFSGRKHPEIPGADPVTREAYSHEVNSAGFWFGDDKVREPAFYTYTSPAPKSLPNDAFETLRYEEVRTAADPRAKLLEFLQSAYERGADAAGWDRAALES